MNTASNVFEITFDNAIVWISASDKAISALGSLPALDKILAALRSELISSSVHSSTVSGNTISKSPRLASVETISKMAFKLYRMTYESDK